MMNFKDEYRIQASKNNISTKILIQTKYKMLEFQKQRKYFTIITIIIAAVLIVCMGVTVFAYEYHQYKLTNNNAGRNHEYLNSNSENVQVENKTAEGKNIRITLKEVNANEKGMYFTVLLKTTDGSDLNINTEECVPILERQRFESAYFIVDNQKIDFTTVFRTDDGSNTTEAVLELAYYNTSDLIDDFKGKEISIVLENFQYDVIFNTSIDFTYSDIGTMIDEEGIAEDKDFSEVGIFITYANGNIISSYSLNAGDKKIYFSEKYSKTYIDNIGFYEYGEMQFKQLYVSIVPESETVKKELLSSLVLLNKVTGEYIYGSQPQIEDSDGVYEDIIITEGRVSMGDGGYVQPDDGRIVLAFDAGIIINNGKNERDSVALTTEILKNYVFVLKSAEETKTVKNIWNLAFNLENVKAAISYEINKDIQRDGTIVRVGKIEVSDSYLYIEGSAGAKFDFKNRGEINLILKDGRKVDVGPKMGGGHEASTGEFSIEGNLETLVDVNEVIAIELWNQIIELQ